ncbi:MAG: DUF296 domain-containing protein [Euryarchaeota archaeon]|jgi:predicted DNA-binding protein with PD1-like motif|uniref:PPC domain-containing DNA-binding protein n=1 Tax=Methanobacterium sp. MZD130B TaxID=3394378 RepID=UPI00176999DA|nr:DUF296 domain-containing protein [Euryarchaeota archaeon]HHT18447.1 DUF296 domain-containing protein [Methanobacterium sp.]
MIVKRLIPGQDLKGSLEDIRDRNNLKSGIIICMVGSLDKAVLRMSDGTKNIISGPLEIVSATGTLAINGVHIHLAVADGNGHVTGGHLMEGSTVNTTVELCVLESDQIFKREFDPDTGFYELVILDEE